MAAEQRAVPNVQGRLLVFAVGALVSWPSSDLQTQEQYVKYKMNTINSK